MDISGKIWGSTSRIFSNSNVEIQRIVGKKGGRCSTHCHKSKWSMFYVEKGEIIVNVEKLSYDLVDQTILKTGQSTTIPPNEYHWFEIVKNGTVAYEIYWVELNLNDITRRDVGSISDL